MRRSTRPQVTAVDDELDAYPDKYLQCRDLRHAWYYVGAFRATVGWGRCLVCSRCRTTREDTYEYGMTRRRYLYPEGYRIEHRAERDEILRQVFSRVTVFDSVEEMLVAVNGRNHDDGGQVIELPRATSSPRRGGKAKAARR